MLKKSDAVDICGAFFARSMAIKCWNARLFRREFFSLLPETEQLNAGCKSDRFHNFSIPQIIIPGEEKTTLFLRGVKRDSQYWYWGEAKDV